jgi:UDP-glucose 4-epimerase
VRDREAVSRALRDHRVEAVLHFASRIQVGESVVSPRLYWRDNLAAGVELLEAVLESGVKHFILSPTAAVYGDPVRIPIDEDHPTYPSSRPRTRSRITSARAPFAIGESGSSPSAKTSVARLRSVPSASRASLATTRSHFFAASFPLA